MTNRRKQMRMLRATDRAQQPSPTDSTRGRRKRARVVLLAQLRSVGSMPCPRCGEPMSIGQELDVGHARAVSQGGARSQLRLEHRSCNRADGKQLALKAARANKVNGKIGNPTRRLTQAEDREAERRQRLADKERARRQRLNRRVIL